VRSGTAQIHKKYAVDLCKQYKFARICRSSFICEKPIVS